MYGRPKGGFAVQQRLSTCVVLAIGAMAPITVGCGAKPHVDPNRTQVSGSVSFDGQPLKAGSISFDSTESGIGTMVTIREGGVYSTDRVPLGANVVTIETESLQFGSPHLYTKIPATYADPSKSGLKVDIQPGVNENVNFDLKK
jgi:hypothetical protein